MKLNFHDLCHIVQTYKLSGPLYNFSGFNFEDINGKLCKLSHGNKRIDLQICRKLERMDSLFFHGALNYEVNKKLSLWKSSFKFGPNSYFCGNKSSLSSSSLANLDYLANLSYKSYFFYERVVLDSQKFSTLNYSINKKFNFSVFFKKKENKLYIVTKIICAQSNSFTDCYFFGQLYSLVSINLGIYKRNEKLGEFFLTSSVFNTDLSPCCIYKEYVLEIPSTEMY